MESEKMNRENQKFLNEFFCSKTGKLKHALVPSLQHVTMVKIAIELWNQIDLRESIVNFKFDDSCRSNWEKWRKIEEKALLKVAQLPLPDLLKKEFLSVISPIGVKIKNWWVYHQEEFHLLELPKEFAWTSQGTIDSLKTAQSLSKDKDMNVDTRYQLSCWYCLEDEIQELWKGMDEAWKLDNYDFESLKLKHPFLVSFWTHRLRGELSKLEDSINVEEDENGLERISIYKWAFKNLVYEGNKAGAEFFLDKLTQREKDLDLGATTEITTELRSKHFPYNDWVPTEYYAELVLLLLPRVSHSRRERLFGNRPYEILDCLLGWPNRLLFVELTERTLRSIDTDEHRGNLVSLIIKNIANGWSDCTSRQLFHHFWNLCPLSYKKRAIEGIDYCTVMMLYERNDEEIVRALFQHACAKEIEQFILLKREIDVFPKTFFREYDVLPSKKTEVKFRMEFLKREKK